MLIATLHWAPNKVTHKRERGFAMGRSTTRIQNLTKVTTLNTGDVFPLGPNSGDRAKGITFKDLLAIITGAFIDPVIVENSGDYIVTINDDLVANTGPSIITVPLSSTAFKPVRLKSVLGGGVLTVNPLGTDTIDGLSSKLITPNASLTLWPVVAGWLIS